MMCDQSASHVRLPSRQHHSLPVVWWDRQDPAHAPDALPRIAAPPASVRLRYKPLSLRALSVVRLEFVWQTCTPPASPGRPLLGAVGAQGVAAPVWPPAGARTW